MSQWKNDDSAANSVLWGPATVKLTPNAANRNALFGNTTADAFITNETVGTYGVDDNETAYDLWKVIAALPTNARGESVIITTDANGQFIANGTTDALINVASITVTTVAVNAAGNSYVTGDIVTLGEGDGNPAATFSVTANAGGDGEVTAIDIVQGGIYADAANAPLGDSITTGGTGSGLVVDIGMGVYQFTVSTAGSFTTDPSGEILLEAQGDQTDANVRINAVGSKYNHAQSVTHAGHVLLREGTGGRAGRIQAETLVTISSMTGDAEDVKFPNT